MINRVKIDSLESLNLLYILLFVFTISCRSTSNTSLKLRNISSNELIDVTTRNNPTFNVINIKYDANVAGTTINNSLSGSIRLIRDSLLWMSVNGPFGIEIARVLLKPDSLKILSYFENLYYYGSYQSAKKILGSELNFSLLQNILTSTLSSSYINYDSLKDQSITESAVGEYVLKANHYDFKTTLKVDSNTYKMKDFSIKKSKQPISIDVSYSNYIKIDNRIFPQNIIINTVGNGSRTTIDLNYRKIIFDKEFRIPFNVPKKFKAVNLNLIQNK